MPPMNELHANITSSPELVPSVAAERVVMPVPFLLREAILADVNPILRLSRLLDSINLPTEESDLTALIQQSTASFRGAIKDRKDGVYLFVLEEQASRSIVATAMILANHGTPESPHFYLEMA